jgi:hypothetical protein
LLTAGNRFLDIQWMPVYFSRMEERQSTTSSTEPPGDRGGQSIRPEQIHQIILFRDELFTAIEIAWNKIPEAEIDKLVGSFRGRCQIWVEIEGECLNGHWWRVHQIHHDNDPANVLQEPTFVEE